MSHLVRHLTIAASALALFALDATALAQSRDKGTGADQPMRKEGGGKDQKGGGQQKAKHHKHHNGKALLGDKKDGKHEFHKHGKFAALADMRGGKVAGVSVKHADKGDVPVTKYKTNKKLTELTDRGAQPALIIQAQYLGTTYVGFAYIDDYGYEVIYWFPYDMVLDPYTGAIDYVPAY